MASVTQLGYLGLNVKNPDEWQRFTTEILGLQPAGSAPDGSIYLRLDENHHRFILQRNDADDVAFIGWEAPEHPALGDFAAQLQAAGLQTIAGTAELAHVRRAGALLQVKDTRRSASEAYYEPLQDVQ